MYEKGRRCVKKGNKKVQTESKAKQQVEQARVGVTDAGEEEEELVAASAVPAYTGILNKSEETETENDQNKFSEAERRLREELAAFKIK